MKHLFAVVFFFSLASFCFSQSFNTQSYPIGGTAGQIIVADFNGDHIPDIATVNGDTVSILINKGDGTFRLHLDFATGPGSNGLAAVDWNKDGKMDLVVSNGGADAAHSVSILLGNGDGTFQPHHDIAGAPNAGSIAVGDFNRDGNPDIATSSNNPVNAVYVSLGNGKGGVVAQKITSGFGIGPQPPPDSNTFLLAKIATADFNHDGKDDLYYIECCDTFVIVGQGAFGVLVSKGDGTFTAGPVIGPLIPPTDLFTVDVNQDGLTDAIMPFDGCHEPCTGTSVAINNGDDTFGGGAGLNLNDTGFQVGGAVFDVDGDGHKDFVLVGVDTNDPSFNPDNDRMTLIIQKQNADGTFASPPEFEGGPSQLITVTLNAPIVEKPATVVADFNHDGKPDLAMVSEFGGPVFVVLNTTPPSACKISTVNHTVTVCHPADGAVGLSPAHIVSHFTSSTAPSVSQIYLDNKLVFQVAGGNIDKNLALVPGEHRLEVKSWTKGQPFHNDFFLSTPKSIPATVPPCLENTNFVVNICSPGQHASVDAPVHVTAAAKSSAPITTMQIYLDNKEVFHSPNSTLIETDVPMSSGAHLLVVKAWDSTGRNFSSSRTITVTQP
ncbi:MAG TPA: VCBS repeat-containing protein [Candidatus Angelobacter sp.]|nr:VCBS repeat-containing protein [Candidatus Angelobacter sp.]